MNKSFIKLRPESWHLFDEYPLVSTFFRYSVHSSSCMHLFEITCTYVRIKCLKIRMFSLDSLNMKLLLHFDYCSKRFFAALALLLSI